MLLIRRAFGASRASGGRHNLARRTWVRLVAALPQKVTDSNMTTKKLLIPALTGALLGFGSLGVGGIPAAHAQQASDAPSATGPGPHAGGEGFGAQRLDRVLDKVGASASQRSQIKALWDGLRPQLRAQHAERAALRKQIVAALSAPTIDTAAIEKLRQQSMGVADKLSSLFTQGIVGTAQILTPDQRKQAQEELAHHAQRFGGAMP